MTDTDHDKAIAAAARKWAAQFSQYAKGNFLTDESRALIAAVEAEEKAREPQLLTADEAAKLRYEHRSEAGDGMCKLLPWMSAVLTAAHQRAAARADWALAENFKDHPGSPGACWSRACAKIVRRALLGKE